MVWSGLTGREKVLIAFKWKFETYAQTYFLWRKRCFSWLLIAVRFRDFTAFRVRAYFKTYYAVLMQKPKFEKIVKTKGGGTLGKIEKNQRGEGPLENQKFSIFFFI